MASVSSGVLTLNRSHTTAIQEHLDGVADDLLASLPPAAHLSAEERRGIIARYTAVLEGNFIYWMTGAYLSVATEEARSIILENLHEESRAPEKNLFEGVELLEDLIRNIFNPEFSIARH